MKKVWVLMLLVSLGLNVGLGVRLLRRGDLPGSIDRQDGRREGRSWSRGERPAPGDSTAWRRVMGRRMDHLTGQLALRPEQIAGFRAAQQASFQIMRTQRQLVVQARSHLRELMTAAEIDQPAVRLAMAELGRRQAAMDSLAAETVLGELEVLDPSQRVRYLDFLPDSGGRRAGRGRLGR